ncbi:MAG: lysophospholipid acyltransferase family protein [Bacteroidales bacterium]|jgi:KDO2-lipid IV(A) lauroyltransferase|nr:lysophospholipid acyltransferase family protein [Bacteroidales bacterium]
MLTRIAIYGFLYPLSLLPLALLYGIGRFIRFFVYTVFRYRIEVVRQNLSNSFPNMPEKELKMIEREYYRHLINIFVEGVKLLTLSKKSLMKRYHCINPDLVNAYYRQGKSVILMSSHYNNWEWMVLSLSMQFKFHGIGVGKPNTNKVFEKIINKARTRYGTEVVFADTVRDTVDNYDKQQKMCAYMLLCDQSPGNVKKSYIAMFMNQPSFMIYGAEYFARKYNYPVLYYVVNQKKRGYYEIEITKITDTPQDTPYGSIIEDYIKYVQRDITKQPQFWLWSHKRWKHHIDLTEKQ